MEFGESTVFTTTTLGLVHANTYFQKTNKFLQFYEFLYNSNNPITNGAVIGTTNLKPTVKILVLGEVAPRYGTTIPATVTIETNGNISVRWQDAAVSAVGEASFSASYFYG